MLFRMEKYGKGFSFRNRVIIIVIGMAIGLASILFTNRMAKQLRVKERNEVELWVNTFVRGYQIGLDFDKIITEDNQIPFIVTNENLEVMHSSLIPEKILRDPKRLRSKLFSMARANDILEVPQHWSNEIYYLFWGKSQLLRTLYYFPYIQIGIIIIFIVFGFITFHSTKQDEQNRVWIGLAKETAHQLGTPTSSLLGWIEYLRAQDIDAHVVDEMNKDVIRLMKVVDRFSKIGSETELREGVVNEIVGGSVLYFRTRVPKNVAINYNGLAMAQEKAMVNEALFEWVIENLLKNSLDAMAGTGVIDVKLSSDDTWIYIDVKDSGKGVAKGNFKRIFDPGFTTKTRGWGLGLSLSKRIIEGYHKGRIFVLDSEPGAGTTIRIMLRKVYS